MIVFLLFLSLFSSSWAKEPRVVKMTEVDMKPPEEFNELSARKVSVSWISMPLDHFDQQNPTNFSMRFMYNEEFFGGDGSPIFILVGGEWDIVEGWLLAGNMYEMARENKGYQVYTEHRYYGETKIFEEFTAENLRFLNIDQALADLAYFIVEMKKQSRFADSEVVLYGGSYAANMVMWFKKRYPHLVVGTVASSGPILAQVDFTGYLEVVHEAFTLEGGEECIGHIRQGIADTVAAMQTENGRRLLEESYRLCDSLDYDNEYELGVFAGLISWSFSTSVQQARPGTLKAVCNNFADTSYGIAKWSHIKEFFEKDSANPNFVFAPALTKQHIEPNFKQKMKVSLACQVFSHSVAAGMLAKIANSSTPMEKIGGYIAATRNLPETSCWFINYNSFLTSYGFPTNSRAWYYQTCTEYGYYQTAPRSGTVFDILKWLSLDFYVDVCKQIFDERFNLAFVKAGADRVNLIFGGLEPVVNNTINIHGYIDPWRALGVYKEGISETSPTYTVDRASHCFDMRGWSASDTIQMTAVQQRARRIVASWLSESNSKAIY